MNRPSRCRLLFGLAAVLLGASALTAETGSSDIFGAYWYQGKAEITSYALEQARYGEVHPGKAVLIFVTEDFSRKKQVKLDRPSAAGEDRVPVMKLNATKKFNTGIYPYSMMTSVFSPVDLANDPRALKITTSSQEWCGHTFTQLNRTEKGYVVLQLSYFESEGDETVTLEDAATEDQIWTTLRTDPDQLPLGQVRLIPGTMVQRLRHLPWGVGIATATRESVEERNDLRAYKLDYPDLNRTLTIHYTKAFPHEIEGWEETYTSGFGQGASRLTTRATKMKRILSDYWTQHDLADAGLREQLGLD